MLKLALIIGSTRPNRFADIPAKWIVEGAQGRDDITLEVLDLRDHPLPLFNEPAPVGYSGGRFTEAAARTLPYAPGPFDAMLRAAGDDDCLRGMLAASPDPRAARRYRLAGFTLHPTMNLRGVVDRSSLPVVERVRVGYESRIQLGHTTLEFCRSGLPAAVSQKGSSACTGRGRMAISTSWPSPLRRSTVPPRHRCRTVSMPRSMISLRRA